MRRIIPLFLLLFLLTAGCSQPNPPSNTSAPESFAVQIPENEEALSTSQTSETGFAENAVALYDFDGIQVALPVEYLELLIVETHEDDCKEGRPLYPRHLLSVRERASVEALERDFGSSDGGGFLFGIVQLDQAGLEEHLLNDYGGVHVFARDETHYYAMTQATDVQFYRGEDSPSIYSQDWADWELLNGLGDDVCQDFLRRNQLEPYSTSAFYQEPFTYEGEHAYAIFYPYQTFDGSLAERYTLVLSQPAVQGEDGIWCVERWYDEFGTCYLNFPGGGVSSTEHYAALQAQCDAEDHKDLLTPLGAAKDFVENSIWFDKEATDENVVPADGIDHDYIEANQRMGRTIPALLVRPETVTDEEILLCISTFQPDTWRVMGRSFYGSDWWPPLQEALTKSAVGEDQINRDHSMMRFYLTSYGRYAEFTGGLLKQQRKADPEDFQTALEEFNPYQQKALLAAVDTE